MEYPYTPLNALSMQLIGITKLLDNMKIQVTLLISSAKQVKGTPITRVLPIKLNLLIA